MCVLIVNIIARIESQSCEAMDPGPSDELDNCISEFDRYKTLNGCSNYQERCNVVVN